MIIIGLGSNQGNRFEYLLTAVKAIANIPGTQIKKYSSLYSSQALLAKDAPNEWDSDFLNAAVACETKCDPSQLLKSLKDIEFSMGRNPKALTWSPRIIDLDILAWHDEIIQRSDLNIPHSQLLHRPFALWPLADIDPYWIYRLDGPFQGKTAAELADIWHSRFNGNAPFKTKRMPHRLETPQIMGILNITPDSFSDGNAYVEPSKALDQAKAMIDHGATVIDVGAESTSPYAKPITEAVEWERLSPVLNQLNQLKNKSIIQPKISLDTRHPGVAERAIDVGIDWINDVSGLDDPKMIAVVREANKKCVIMHHYALPENRQFVMSRSKDPIDEVLTWGKTRLIELAKKGINLDNLIFDPGIGFGKMAEQSWAILKRINDLKILGLPLLIGHSRKSFLSLLTDQAFCERDIETLAVSQYLAQQKVDFLRVHHVDMTARGLNAFCYCAN